jgi:nucleotide-binding universal stress UspA family protein
VNFKAKRILMALDGSDQSLESVRYVSKFFPPQEIHFVLFNVFSRVPEFLYDMEEKPQFGQSTATIVGCEMALEESMKGFMTEARQILIDSGIPDEAITIDIHAKESGVARDIIAESTGGYGAVVLGRNGVNRIKDFVLGSVAIKLLDTLMHISMCVVGGKPDSKKILLALDRSAGSMRAVDYLGDMLGGSTDELTLFHAARHSDIPEGRFGHIVNLMREKESLELNEMESIFDEARARLLSKGFEPKALTVKTVTGVSSRAAAILQEANEGGYGTIVVGRRGLSKVYEFSMGRVANKVIQLARDHAVWIVS